MMTKTNKKRNEFAHKYANILGINVLSTSRVKLLASLRNRLAYNINHGYDDPFYITTPNPEQIVMSESDLELRKALNGSDFAVPDGIGLKFACKYLYGKDLTIIKGRKLFADLISLANKKRWKVFFLGGEGDEAEKAAEKLRLSYKGIKIETFRGPVLDKNGEPVSENDIQLYKDSLERINKFAPVLLFVAFGNPKQEKWVVNNLSHLRVGGAMTVGGSFRYAAGISKLPPKWMEETGLEWIWRLLTEPSRFARIFNAWPVFPVKVWMSKIRS